MKRIIPCLFYIKENKVDTYILEENNVIKIGTFEEFELEHMETFWNWWIGAISYILEEQCLDLCILTNNLEAELESEQIQFADTTSWTVDKIRRCLARDYDALSFKLNYRIDDRVEQVIIQSPQLDLKYRGVSELNIFIKANNFILQKSETIAERSLNKQNEEVDESLEEGILYKYFNSQTDFYCKKE